jgi:septal ring factor EnvC (AmiA/AmiB activator)
VVAVIVSACVLGSAAIVSAEEDAAKLKRLRGRIQTLQTQLNKTVHKRDSEREEVRQLENRIGSRIRTLRQLDARLKDEAKRLRDLQAQRAAAQNDLGYQTKGLEAQVQAAYAMGRDSYFKLLLNQDDPASVSRMLVYYRYLNKARVRHIDNIKAGLVKLRQVEDQITRRTRELEALRTTQVEQKQALGVSRTRRTQVLASLNRQVRDQTEEIARLRRDESRLERLLEQLQEYLADAPVVPALKAHFRENKGKLPLPARGKILARYGALKSFGKLRWKGVFLAGRIGQDVISVAHGRVAFADWLRGFGLLLILEHGDGYMTLYGHNQSLYAQVGDWVQPGQVVASMGNTGDAPQAGVYFEIRQRGQPRDPLKWCRVQ